MLCPGGGVPTLAGGGCLTYHWGGGVLSLARGYLPWIGGGVPTLPPSAGRYPPVSSKIGPPPPGRLEGRYPPWVCTDTPVKTVPSTILRMRA